MLRVPSASSRTTPVRDEQDSSVRGQTPNCVANEVEGLLQHGYRHKDIHGPQGSSLCRTLRTIRKALALHVHETWAGPSSTQSGICSFRLVDNFKLRRVPTD